MKILLIYPPALNLVQLNIPFVVDTEAGSHPPLGLMSIAAYVEKNSKYEVEILDTQVEKMDYNAIENEITKRRPDVVGIQAMSFAMKDVIKTARIVKKIDQNIIVCLGGPHVHIYPRETLNLSDVDIVVMGEGEITFNELIHGIVDKTDLSKVKGIGFKQNSRIVLNELREYNTQLDELPFPARHLVPYRKYFSSVAKYTPISTMITSRGCPYKCIFCDRPHFGHLFRTRSAENVVDEMEECTKMGIKEIYFFDDTFTVDKKRVMTVCNEISRRGLNIAWTIRARVDTVDRELLIALKRAGCYRIHYGVESGVAEVLRVLKKGTNLERIENVFKMTHDVGILTVGYFMFGSPSEKKSQMLETIRFSKKLKADFAQFAITTPYPATELYSMGLSTGILKEDCWQKFAADPMSDFEPPLWEEHVDKNELIQILGYAYKSFYMRPGYMIKRIMEVRSWQEFKRKAKAALGIRKI